jgi:hypothetical protein
VSLIRIKILERQNGPQYKKNEDNHVLNLLGFGFLWGELRIFLELGSLSRGPQKKKKSNFSSTVYFANFMLKKHVACCSAHFGVRKLCS